ncbi:phosphatase PAP2 family protein [Dehalogenimonas sp. THU2]|uniref:phosphatase PAP2 family protein n=1 Tax=Dehalogenimonas sp. THU2 TaxID=3151121 RepID=UPI003218CBB6
METLINIDQALAQAINALAGRFWLLDEIVKGVANDYFLIVSASLGLLLLWFGTIDPARRETNQKIALQAMASLGLGTWVVAIFNSAIFRSRPFDEIPITVLLYQPTDSSFPANSATILFAIAAAVWLGNRKAGRLFFIVAAVHSLARIYAGMYYPLDILGGAVIGIITALIVFVLFQTINPIVNWLLRQARKLFLA